MYKLNTLPFFPPDIVALDIETTGLDRFNDKIVAVGLSDGNETWILTERFERICSLLENPDVLKIIHNADFDLTFICRDYGCKPQNIYDTLVIERILNNGYEIPNKLEEVLARRFGILVDKSLQTSFEVGQELTEAQCEYLRNDVVSLLQLREVQLKDIEETSIEKIRDLENDVILPVLDMTMVGIGFNETDFYRERDKITGVLDDLQTQIQHLLGADFYIEVSRKSKGDTYTEQIPLEQINYRAWQQTLPLLQKLGLKIKDTREATLLSVKDQHPFVPLLLEHKEWSGRLKWHWDDFIAADGRIHPKWNQTGTDTGRFSSQDPNIQQIPRPEPNKPNFRALFKPLDGHTLICADFSQQEPRILAHVSQDPAMIEAANESDIYIAFARTVWGKEIKKGDPERQLAKTGVLATFYGVYPKKLAEQMGISVQEATALRKKILRSYPVAARWGDKQLRNLVMYGYTQTVWGRRRYFPEAKQTKKDRIWIFANRARNTPIQGTGADVMKLALVKVHKLLQDYDAHLIWTIHDELGVSVRKDQAEDLLPKVLKAMEDAGHEICPSVRFIAEGKITDSWSH